MHRLATHTLTLLTALTLGGALVAGCNSGDRPSSSTSAGATGTGGPPGAATFLLSVAPTGSGSVTIDPPSANNRYAPGSTVTLTAVPDAGWTFEEWGGDLSGTQTFSVQIVLQNDMNLAPVFLQVAPNSPTAAFATTPDPPQWIAPLTVTFQDQSSNAPTGWLWDFGDGTTDATPNPSHTYTQPGTYTVSLRVAGATGPGTPLVRTALVYVADPSEGSRFWYETDRYQNPFKSNDATQASLAQQVLDLVNQERAAAGAPPLQRDPEAERAAKVHSEDMLARNFFSHDTPEGWSPGDRLRMTGASGYSRTGENIARGQQTPAAVMQAWMNSPGHRANILDPAFTHIGIGVSNGPHWTQVFLTR